MYFFIFVYEKLKLTTSSPKKYLNKIYDDESNIFNKIFGISLCRVSTKKNEKNGKTPQIKARKTI